MTVDERLTNIADQLRADKPVPPETVREFLSWFGALRRGYWIVENIRSYLKRAGIRTTPDFESVYMDSHIGFELDVQAPEDKPQAVINAFEALTAAVSGGAEAATSAYSDPRYRISKLAAANVPPVVVSPDTSIAEVVTLMLQKDFSQLPVMTSERDVKGVVSWHSIGSRLALGKGGAAAREMMQAHHELSTSASIFDAIPIIVDHDYVLVRSTDNKISGIVTASDLSVQFQQLSEPFLLIGEIENHVRRVIAAKFNASELAQIREQPDAKRPVERVSDLTFGEYIRLLEEPGRWSRLGLAIDRGSFCRGLDRVREIRNDVMHFDPDGIPPEDLENLRQFCQFLQRLQDLGAT